MKTITNLATALTILLAIVAAPAAFGQDSSLNGHEWVDLGLPSGLKWATCNVGAPSPEAYGNYFAWGETSPKSEYTEGNSLTCGKDIDTLKAEGIINDDGDLTRAHDAASANWGSTWRMPTKAEFDELVSECSWEWTTQGGHTGYRVTGPNGQSIFLPAGGGRYGTSFEYFGMDGYYWSSKVSNRANCAYRLIIGSEIRRMILFTRYYGFSVRPVTE